MPSLDFRRGGFARTGTVVGTFPPAFTLSIHEIFLCLFVIYVYTNQTL